MQIQDEVNLNDIVHNKVVYSASEGARQQQVLNVEIKKLAASATV